VPHLTANIRTCDGSPSALEARRRQLNFETSRTSWTHKLEGALMLAAAIAIAVVVIVGFWIAGGMLLHFGGLVVAIFGILVLAFDHSLAGITLLVVGVLLWLAGHWHYALRHHVYKSPLSHRIFQQLLPDRLDPTRGWSWPVTITNPPKRRPPSPPS
jgi:hypothetical protein